MKYNFFWFRRDLRFDDNVGLEAALLAGLPVVPVFIFDTNILDELPKRDRRVQYIYDVISEMSEKLNAQGSRLLVEYGDPLEVWKRLTKEFDIHTVYTNMDFEPYANRRDSAVKEYLGSIQVNFETKLDHLLFHPSAVVKKDGSPYTVFTPYKNQFLVHWSEKMPAMSKSEDHLDTFWKREASDKIISLDELGFEEMKFEKLKPNFNVEMLEGYAEKRDFPALDATSKLGTALRFGRVSVRKVAQNSKRKSDVYFSEIVWREFYAMVLYHFPQVVHASFKPEYDKIEWENNVSDFEAWKEGRTGYPFVDAGMRQLNETGFMHNRLRMVTASFLCKHLLIDWRWGESYFAEKLLDYDLASNNGGWQWSAGTGTDAAPYFRIFNPETQFEKFDPKREFVKKWVPEVGTDAYPQPIVNHEFARSRCLAAYKSALQR